MTKPAMRSESDTSELIAVRQEAMETKSKVESMHQHLGELQSQVTGIQSQMNRIESLLQGLSTAQHHAAKQHNGVGSFLARNDDTARLPTDPAMAQGIEMEITRRMKALNHVQLNSTQGVNFNNTPEVNLSHPHTGRSAAPVCWGQNISSPATPRSPTFNRVEHEKDQYMLDSGIQIPAMKE